MSKKSAQTDKKKAANEKSLSVLQQNPFQSLKQQMNRLMEDFDRLPFGSHWLDMRPFTKLKAEAGIVVPAIDVVDEDACYRVTAELPGLSERNIDISKDGDFLTIRGEKKEEREEKKKGYFMSERHFGSFTRTLRLPNAVDDSKIDAKFANGVLTVTLPKKPGATSSSRKIAIKAS